MLKQLERNSRYKSFVAASLIFLLLEGYSYRAPLLNVSMIYPIALICFSNNFLNFSKLTITREFVFLLCLGALVFLYWVFHSLVWLQYDCYIIYRFITFFSAVVIGLFIRSHLSFREIIAGINFLVMLSFVALIIQYIVSHIDIYLTFNIPLTNTLHDATFSELHEWKVGLIKSNRYFSFFSEPSKIGFFYGMYLHICRSKYLVWIMIIGIILSTSALGFVLLLFFIIGKIRFSLKSLIFAAVFVSILYVTNEIWLGLFQLEYGIILKIAPRLLTPWVVFLSLPLFCRYLGLGFGNIGVYDSLVGIDTSGLFLPILNRSELYYANTIVSGMYSIGLLGMLGVASILFVYGMNNGRVRSVLISTLVASSFSSLFLLPEMIFLVLLLWLKRTRK